MFQNNEFSESCEIKDATKKSDDDGHIDGSHFCNEYDSNLRLFFTAAFHGTEKKKL